MQKRRRGSLWVAHFHPQCASSSLSTWFSWLRRVLPDILTQGHTLPQPPQFLSAHPGLVTSSSVLVLNTGAGVGHRGYDPAWDTWLPNPVPESVSPSSAVMSVAAPCQGAPREAGGWVHRLGSQLSTLVWPSPAVAGRTSRWEISLSPALSLPLK